MEKPGECPRSLPSDMLGLCANLCNVDNDCAPQDKCCSTGCGRGCVPPKAGFCLVEGDIAVAVGDTIRMSPCKNCTCVAPGQMKCPEMMCPDMNPRKCDRVITRPGECCPVCDSGMNRCTSFLFSHILVVIHLYN